MSSLGFSIIDSTLGAVFIGFAVACFAFGILIAQIFSYVRRYPDDKAVFRILVLLILLLEIADQIFIGHLVYYYGIKNYANPIVLIQSAVTWSFVLQVTTGAVVGAIVKASFSLRVYRFSNRNIFITGVLLLFTFGQLVLALIYTVKAFALPSVFSASKLRVLGSTSLGVGVLTDIIIAGSLCFFLNKLRTGYSTSDSIINSLCKYAVNTGALTSAVSITTLVLYNATPNTSLYFIATYFTVSKLYAISFMATLNTRRTVGGRGTDRDTTKETNMFHLGTRAPTRGVAETAHWDTGKEEEQGFPQNSFHRGDSSYSSTKTKPYP